MSSDINANPIQTVVPKLNSLAKAFPHLTSTFIKSYSFNVEGKLAYKISKENKDNDCSESY